MAAITVRCCHCQKVVGVVDAPVSSGRTTTTDKPCYDCENAERMQHEAAARYQATRARRN